MACGATAVTRAPAPAITGTAAGGRKASTPAGSSAAAAATAAAVATLKGRALRLLLLQLLIVMPPSSGVVAAAAASPSHACCARLLIRARSRPPVLAAGRHGGSIRLPVALHGRRGAMRPVLHQKTTRIKAGLVGRRINQVHSSSAALDEEASDSAEGGHREPMHMHALVQPGKRAVGRGDKAGDVAGCGPASLPPKETRKGRLCLVPGQANSSSSSNKQERASKKPHFHLHCRIEAQVDTRRLSADKGVWGFRFGCNMGWMTFEQEEEAHRARRAKAQSQVSDCDVADCDTATRRAGTEVGMIERQVKRGEVDALGRRRGHFGNGSAL